MELRKLGRAATRLPIEIASTISLCFKAAILMRNVVIEYFVKETRIETMGGETLTEVQRLLLVRELWMLRPVAERTDSDVVNFYQQMEEEHPEYLRHGPGDDYQRLRADLTGLIPGPVVGETDPGTNLPV